MSYSGITRTTEIWHGPFSAEFVLAKSSKSTGQFIAIALGMHIDLEAPLWVLEDTMKHCTAQRVWATLEETTEPMGVKFFLTAGEEATGHARRLVYLFLEERRGRAIYRLYSQRVQYRLSVPKDLFGTLQPPQKMAAILTLAG